MTGDRKKKRSRRAVAEIVAGEFEFRGLVVLGKLPHSSRSSPPPTSKQPTPPQPNPRAPNTNDSGSRVAIHHLHGRSWSRADVCGVAFGIIARSCKNCRERQRGLCLSWGWRVGRFRPLGSVSHIQGLSWAVCAAVVVLFPCWSTALRCLAALHPPRDSIPGVTCPAGHNQMFWPPFSQPIGAQIVAAASGLRD